MTIKVFPIPKIELVKQAITYDPNQFDLLPELKNDVEIVCFAVSKGYAYNKLNADLQLNEKVVAAAANAIFQNKAAPAPAKSWDAPIIRIGNDLPKDLMERITSALEHNQNKKVYPHPIEITHGTPFIRDTKIILANGCHSIPIAHPYLWSTETGVVADRVLFAAMPLHLQKSLMHGEKSICIMGRGGSQVSEQALVTSYQEGAKILYQRGLIEGGNLFLFKKEGLDYAIIGEVTIYLSWLNLMKMNFFHNMTLPALVDPSEDSYRAVKNMIFPFLSIDWISFSNHLKSPVPGFMKPMLRLQAMVFEEQIKLTKSIISLDLGIPLDRIVFVPQRNYHIDLEMNVTPSGEVLLHDPQKVVDTVENLLIKRSNTEEEVQLLEEFLQEAKHEVELHAETVALIKQTLETAGFTVKLLPLSFIAKDKKVHLNYANGIFEKNKSKVESGARKRRKSQPAWVYFTSGPSLKSENNLHKHAVKLITNEISDLKIVAIQGLSQFIFMTHGGLRCLSLIG